MKRLIVGILLALLLGFLLSPVLVYADTPDPDPNPTIEDTNIYRNLLETGDMLFIIYVNIPYTSVPNTTVTQAFIWRLIDTDNITVLGSTTGFAYNDDGYGYNVYSFYFSASEVITLGMVWGDIFTIRLSGNPVAFDTPPIYNFYVNVANYSTETVTAEVQAELADRIIFIAADLYNKWGLLPVESLLTQNETATVLSVFGEAFFRGAVHGLQAMAPGAFSVMIRVLDVEDRDWDPEYSENVTAQWAGTWIETAQEGGRALFGTDYDLLSIIMLSAMSVALLIGNIMLTGDHWNGLVDVTVLCVIGARLAMYDLAFLMLVAAVCWIYIGMKVWFGLIKT